MRFKVEDGGWLDITELRVLPWEVGIRVEAFVGCADPGACSAVVVVGASKGCCVCMNSRN